MNHRHVGWWLLMSLATPSLGAANKKETVKAVETSNPPKSSGKYYIDIWTRQKGDHFAAKVPRQGAIAVEMNGMTFNEVTHHDIQYNKELTFRGLPLSDVVRLYKPWVRGMDLVILHFKNGMVLPVGRDDLLKKGEIFLALEFKNAAGQWVTEFPKAQVPGTAPEEKQFITFAGNKLVASRKWLQAMEQEGKHQQFNPWRHFDSLVGLEIVDPAAYYNQFRLAGDKKDSYFGRLVYIDRCQFCHAVGGVGARYGTDFLKPQPVSKRQNAAALFAHVSSHETKKDTKIRMPHQPDFTEKEARDLWQWLDAAGRGALSSYEPFYRPDFKEPPRP